MQEEKLAAVGKVVSRAGEGRDPTVLLHELRAAVEAGGEGGGSLKEQRLEKVTKENKELVLRCKETDIKLKQREQQFAALQQKATDDALHITNLGSVIEKLRRDIANLEATVDNVKNTQEKVTW